MSLTNEDMLAMMWLGKVAFRAANDRFAREQDETVARLVIRDSSTVPSIKHQLNATFGMTLDEAFKALFEKRHPNRTWSNFTLV